MPDLFTYHTLKYTVAMVSMVKWSILSCRQTVYNVGNPGNVVRIEDLAKQIIALCDSSSAIQYVDPHKVYGKTYLEAFEKIPDITRVTTDTGWKPVTDLTCSLGIVLDHYVHLADLEHAACLA